MILILDVMLDGSDAKGLWLWLDKTDLGCGHITAKSPVKESWGLVSRLVLVSRPIHGRCQGQIFPRQVC